MVPLRFALASAALLMLGCAGDNGGMGDGSPASSSSTGRGDGGHAGHPGDGGGGGGGAAPAGVVINEISAVGSDWIELANAGDAPLDLGSVGLCDSDANGQCNVAEALRFPAGTQLAPDAFLLIACDQPAGAGPGPHTECIPGGPGSCFYVTWKVSASNGETLFLIDANNAVLSATQYPQNAVQEGQTWSRIPDRIGAFAAGAPTPGAPNAAP
jgi:Lamin Tail Domain